MLGYLFSAADTYLHDMADDHTLPIEEVRREILRKAVTKSGGAAYSMADRFAELAKPIGPDERGDELLVRVMGAWRNLAVHEERSAKDVKSRLESVIEAELVDYEPSFASRYGDFSARMLVAHVKSNRAPTRKDIVALASATQNYVRWIDGAILRSFITNAQVLVDLAHAEIRKALMSPDDRPLRAVWGRDVEARERRLRSVLEKAGFTDAADFLPTLPDTFLSDLAASVLPDVIQRLSLSSR
jgi:hypothetical protein